MSEDQEKTELSPEQLAQLYPKMLFKLKPNPNYIEAEDPIHEQKLLKQGWKTADELTERQVQSCVNQDVFVPSVQVDADGQKGSAQAVMLQGIAFAEFKAEVNERFDELEGKIQNLQRELDAVTEAPAEPESPETTPEAPAPEGGNDEPTPPADDSAGGAQGQEQGDGDRYSDLAPIISKFLQEDPDKQSEQLWTKEGAPNANVLSEQAGFEVSAEERDNVWARYQRAQARRPR